MRTQPTMLPSSTNSTGRLKEKKIRNLSTVQTQTLVNYLWRPHRAWVDKLGWWARWYPRYIPCPALLDSLHLEAVCTHFCAPPRAWSWIWLQGTWSRSQLPNGCGKPAIRPKCKIPLPTFLRVSRCTSCQCSHSKWFAVVACNRDMPPRMQIHPGESQGERWRRRRVCSFCFLLIGRQERTKNTERLTKVERIL